MQIFYFTIKTKALFFFIFSYLQKNLHFLYDLYIFFFYSLMLYLSGYFLFVFRLNQNKIEGFNTV